MPKLGREITIPADAEFQEAGTGVQFGVPHYVLDIAIGKDNSFSVFISEDDLKALNEYKHEIKI